MVLNEHRPLYEDDPRVTLIVGASVESLEIANNVVTGVRYTADRAEHVARGDLVGLGANAFFNPFIMLQSGMTDAALGRGLLEQSSAHVNVLLDGVDMSWNTPRLRDGRAKWRQRLTLKFIFEDLPRT